MTKDEIIELAKECGYWSGETVEMNDVGLERFAALVAAAERERLAQPERQWQRLTHPQIHELDWPEDVSFEDILPFVRAIEAKIKEKNGG